MSKPTVMIMNMSFDDSNQSFMEHAQPAIEALQIHGRQLETDMKSLVKYYGEANDMKPEDLFGTIVAFSNALHVRTPF